MWQKFSPCLKNHVWSYAVDFSLFVVVDLGRSGRHYCQSPGQSDRKHPFGRAAGSPGCSLRAGLTPPGPAQLPPCRSGSGHERHAPWARTAPRYASRATFPCPSLQRMGATRSHPCPNSDPAGCCGPCKASKQKKRHGHVQKHMRYTKGMEQL